MSQPEFTEEELQRHRGRDGPAPGRRRAAADARHADQPRRPQGRAGRGARRGAPQRDLAQTRQAIDGARALLPLLEERHGEELAPVKDALSRLQMAFVQLSGGAAAPAAEPGEPTEPAQPEAPATPGDPGPAQRSGRLWVPGQ